MDHIICNVQSLARKHALRWREGPPCTGVGGGAVTNGKEHKILLDHVTILVCIVKEQQQKMQFLLKLFILLLTKMFKTFQTEQHTCCVITLTYMNKSLYKPCKMTA